jgi:hypothetical protein
MTLLSDLMPPQKPFSKSLSVRKHGKEEGHVCNRQGCKGVIQLEDVENCTCHLGHPPCGACVSTALYCPECKFLVSGD